MRSFRQTNKWIGYVYAAGFGSFLLTTSFEAPAQEVDPQKAAAAQALFEQAMGDMAAQQFVNACKKFEEVTRLVPEGVGGKYMLGECYERLGKLASAWAQFSLASQLANRLGQTDRADDANARAAALKPRLATLVVLVPDAVRNVPGISVTRDGVDLRDAQWGTAIYVDAGQHEVVVTAPGYTIWKKPVEVLTDGVNVKLAVPDDAIKLEVKIPPKESGPIIPVVIMLPAPDHTWQRPVGIASSAIAVATLVTGSVLGGLAIGKKNESNASGHCMFTTNKCDATGLTQRKEAVGLGNASTGFFVAGAVLGAVGVVLWVTAPKAGKAAETHVPQGQTKVGLEIGPGRAGVNIHF